MKPIHLFLLALACLAIVQPAYPRRKFWKKVENAFKKIKVCTGPVCIERGKRSIDSQDESLIKPVSQCKFPAQTLAEADEATFFQRPGPRPRIPDPLFINSTAVSINEDDIKGNFSIRNGVIRGLSTLRYNPRLHRPRLPSNDSFLELKIFIRDFNFSGDYEVTGGFANLSVLGVHTFSGSGPMSISASFIRASLRSVVEIDPETSYVSLGSPKSSLNLHRGNITAENFRVDGQLVDWVNVNKNWDLLLDGLQEEIQTEFVDELNERLEGCTLRDLERIFQFNVRPMTLPRHPIPSVEIQ